MKYLLAGLTFIVVFAFFIALALVLVYAGNGVIEFGAELVHVYHSLFIMR